MATLRIDWMAQPRAKKCLTCAAKFLASLHFLKVARLKIQPKGSQHNTFSKETPTYIKVKVDGTLSLTRVSRGKTKCATYLHPTVGTTHPHLQGRHGAHEPKYSEIEGSSNRNVDGHTGYQGIPKRLVQGDPPMMKLRGGYMHPTQGIAGPVSGNALRGTPMQVLLPLGPKGHDTYADPSGPCKRPIPQGSSNATQFGARENKKNESVA